MNPAEADALARRIVDYWRRGPIEEWIDALTELDAGTAGTAFVRLRSSDQHPPTVARFLEVYRSLDTATTAPYDRNCIHNRCPGDGWNTQLYKVHVAHPQTGQPMVLADASGEIEYRGSIPCTCPQGQRNEKVWRSIRDSRQRMASTQLALTGDF